MKSVVILGASPNRNKFGNKSLRAYQQQGYAARHLCEDLNRMQPVTLDKFHFPIHYRVE